MTIRYVPILKWKQGERIALGHLSPNGRKDVVPHIVLTQTQFGGPPKRGNKPAKTAGKIPLSAAEYFTKQVSDAWAGGQIYVDAADLMGTTAHHDLDAIRKAGNALGLNLVPSTKLNPPAAYKAAITRAVKTDGKGTALRISLKEMTAADVWTGSWPFALNETDLIVDLGASVSSVLALGISVETAFQTLHQSGAWRSVTVAGGNIPATLGGYFVGRTMLPRCALALWANLQNSSLPYRLNFGDYGTVGPEAITDGIEGPVPINAKYTVASDFAVYHGVKIKGPGAKPRDQQYRNYASDIVKKLPARSPLAHCWGDQMIDAIAASPTTSPGSPASWVSFSMNRHIEFTRTQLP